MTSAGFDAILPRRSARESKKWWRYPEEVLPMWIADMDFAVAEPILESLRRRLEHPVLGYAVPTDGLREAVAEALLASHGWAVHPDELVFLPGIEPGVNMALKALLEPGDGVVVQTPMYPPVLDAPGHWGLERIDAALVPGQSGHVVDRDGLERAATRARAFLLCNPHNPTGRVLTRDELSFIAGLCERHDLLIVSDEVHCDLVYGGHRHIPIAALSPEIAARTITLMSASKTYNIPGLKTAFAIVPDARRRRLFQDARLGMVDSNNLMGLIATEAAYRHGEPWRRTLLAYLEGNRDHLAAELARRFPRIGFHPPEATFLAWLDCSALGLEPDPYRFFLEAARIGFSDGREFGTEGRGHVRLNFGAPRALLDTALDRMEAALAG